METGYCTTNILCHTWFLFLFHSLQLSHELLELANRDLAVFVFVKEPFLYKNHKCRIPLGLIESWVHSGLSLVTICEVKCPQTSNLFPAVVLEHDVSITFIAHSFHAGYLI